jgi:hypothetical protein
VRDSRTYSSHAARGVQGRAHAAGALGEGVAGRGAVVVRARLAVGDHPWARCAAGVCAGRDARPDQAAQRQAVTRLTGALPCDGRANVRWRAHEPQRAVAVVRARHPLPAQRHARRARRVAGETLGAQGRPARHPLRRGLPTGFGARPPADEARLAVLPARRGALGADVQLGHGDARVRRAVAARPRHAPGCLHPTAAEHVCPSWAGVAHWPHSGTRRPPSVWTTRA